MLLEPQTACLHPKICRSPSEPRSQMVIITCAGACSPRELAPACLLAFRIVDRIDVVIEGGRLIAISLEAFPMVALDGGIGLNHVVSCQTCREFKPRWNAGAATTAEDTEIASWYDVGTLEVFGEAELVGSIAHSRQPHQKAPDGISSWLGP